MALARTYNVDTGAATGITLGSTTPGAEFPILYGQITAGNEFNISAIRVGTISGTGASYPSNGTMTWRLRRVNTGATFTTGLNGGTATANPVSQSTTIAASTWYYSTLTNATGTFSSLATTACLWEQTIPCTAGANWGEWFTPGFELNVGVDAGSGTVMLTYNIANGTVSAVNAIAGLVISE